MIRLNANQTLIRKPQTGNQTVDTFTCCMYNLVIESLGLLKTMKPAAHLFRSNPPPASSFLVLLLLPDCLFPLASPTLLGLNFKCPPYIQEEEEEGIRICFQILSNLFILSHI